MFCVPREAYFYWPDSQNCLVENEEYVERFIFYRQTFKDWEVSALEVLEKLVGDSPFDSCEHLRFLYGAGWNVQLAVSAIQGHRTWIQKWPDYRGLMPFIEPVLKSGGLYVHGRDHRYRPLVFVNPSLLQNFSVDLLLSTVYYLFEYSIETLFLPGQIENFTVILNLSNFHSSETCLIILNTIQQHYPCRLFKAFIQSASRFPSHFLKHLSKNTLNKIHFTDSNLLKTINPGQLESKNGGTCENLKIFWPPTFPPSSFSTKNDPKGGFLSKRSSYNEHLLQHLKNSSNLGSFKISQHSESFFSNSEFKDEIWQKLEDVDLSFSFLQKETKAESEPDAIPLKRGRSSELTQGSTLKKLSIDLEFLESSCMEKCLLI